MNQAEESDAKDREGHSMAFARASFSIDLNLPNTSPDDLESAGQALRREFRDAAKWKRLRCRNVRVISEAKTGTVYELEIGHAIDFDWTWEGSVALRPILLKEFEDTQATLFNNGSLYPDIEDSIVWSGEVLEVDEATGRIFIVASDPEHPPRRGSFYVSPFEFLACLDAIFNDPAFKSIRHHLPSRLAATAGGIHPEAIKSSDIGLDQLRTLWRKSWSILWGPPGTGKTYTIGQQVAKVLADPTERILVVSSTNKATDGVALSIGRAARSLGVELELGAIRRIGKGASFGAFDAEGMTELLRGTEPELLAEIETQTIELAKTEPPEARALIRHRIKELRTAMQDASRRNFLDADVQVVVSTAFKATSLLNHDEVREELERGKSPYTTIFIDEAGLMSRVATAALSLLASHRVILVGDSKQLAPISRISRILEPAQGNWLARSGLSHLDQVGEPIAGVHVLQQQSRMHSDVCKVVSDFQYDGFLTTATDIASRTAQGSMALPKNLEGQPRTIWYVLDEDANDLPSIRAERGPGNQSWVRAATVKVLQKLFADPTIRSANGLFISPFKAQAKAIHKFFASQEMHSWSASTVHSQQGSEADIIIFDSVNAGSYGWAYDEWKRLVNVALSRGREAIIVLASRAEMEEPYLRPLVAPLAARVLRKRGSQISWETVPTKAAYSPPGIPELKSSYLLGNQLANRKELRPVLSHEQQRLCGLELDGKPRLVRGVAGSGKTVVLAHWLMQTVQRLADESNVRIWAVFGNRALQSLIGGSIVSAWEAATGGKSFPWDRVELHHIKEILQVLLPEVGLSLRPNQFDYDAAAEEYLQRKPVSEITARCDALFIDEAQDLGPSALKLLAAIVRRTNGDDENSRSINIFYDNAQNIYGRGTPKWSEFGLDMRGRSTVMKESFRSTRPIIELALNVLYRLQPPESNADHKELMTRGLIERSTKKDADWWNVRYNQINGPKPEFRRYASLEQEFEAIGDYCRELIEDQGVQPTDICLIYNGRNIPDLLRKTTMPKLTGLGVELSIQTNRPFERSSHILLATTPHSYKGYDSEIVIVPGVDQYQASGKGVLANTLYVAMTRARSVLTLFSQSMKDHDAQRLYEVIGDCLGHLEEAPEVESEISPQDDVIAILDRIGNQHRKWLVTIWNKCKVMQEPMVTKEGQIIADPLVSFRIGKQTYACFGNELPRKSVIQKLEDFDVKVIVAGEPVDGDRASE